MTRSAILKILREDYVLNARAYGLNQFSIMNRYVLRNSSRPIITVLGNEFAFLIGGLVITEQVFNLNGIGALLLQSLENADYIVTQNLVMLLAFIFRDHKYNYRPYLCLFRSACEVQLRFFALRERFDEKYQRQS